MPLGSRIATDGRRRGLIREQTVKRLLAFSLVWALLLCHGVSACLHPPVAECPGAGHSSHLAVMAAPLSDPGEQPSVGMGHIAALIFLLGAAFGLWFTGSRKDQKVRVLPLVYRKLPVHFPYPVRAPTLASLQVFRL